MTISGNIIAVLIVALVAAIILKAAKKVIGILVLCLAVFLLMRFAVPIVM